MKTGTGTILWALVLGLSGCDLGGVATVRSTEAEPSNAGDAKDTGWLVLSTPSRTGEVVAGGLGVLVTPNSFLNLDIGARWRTLPFELPALPVLLGTSTSGGRLCLTWRDPSKGWSEAGSMQENCWSQATSQWSTRALPALGSDLAGGFTRVATLGTSLWRIEESYVVGEPNNSLRLSFLRENGTSWTKVDSLTVPDLVGQEIPEPVVLGDQVCVATGLGTLRCGQPGKSWHQLDEAGAVGAGLLAKGDTLVFALGTDSALSWKPGALPNRGRREAWMGNLLLSSPQELVRWNGAALERYLPGKGWAVLPAGAGNRPVWRVDGNLVQEGGDGSGIVRVLKAPL